MRSWILPAILGLAILVIVVGTPFFWQWSYEAQLLHTVAVGSTQQQYKTALWAGELGQGFPGSGITFARPLNFHGMVYTIFAFPCWDPNGRLVGYDMCAKFSIPGQTWWLSRPSPKAVSSEFYSDFR